MKNRTASLALAFATAIGAAPTARAQHPNASDASAASTLSRLHRDAYSMVAYPWAFTYQQSNQWAIETLAAAADPAVTTRAHAQAWLRRHDYRPAMLRIDTLERLGASVARANVAFDEHPPAQRFAGRIETVSADSVLQWLALSGLGEQVQVLR